jgi:hypothetical protein
MRGTSLLAIGLMLATGPVVAAEAASSLDALPTVGASELDGSRGGTDTSSAFEANSAALQASNSGTITTGYGALKTNGMISGTTLAGNSGMATVMANSGDLVNMNNATNINIYMR